MNGSRQVGAVVNASGPELMVASFSQFVTAVVLSSRATADWPLGMLSLM